jgi:molybdenum ABC transporter molybdate-binding protein
VGWRASGAALAMIAASLHAQADAGRAKVYAAGSLRAALTDASAAFSSAGGGAIAFEFGPSGALRDRLAQGEAADVFASANTEHPKALADAGKAEPMAPFARNGLCALAPAKLGVTSANLLERMLDPGVKLATSTPKADPAGDYAWQVFERAEKVRPGAYEELSKKALKLVGGPSAPSPPPGRTAYAMLVAGGQADIFLTYCTNATLAQREEPALAIIALPEELAVGAEYGLVVMKGASDTGRAFARFLLSSDGRAILSRHGFAAP